MTAKQVTMDFILDAVMGRAFGHAEAGDYEYKNLNDKYRVSDREEAKAVLVSLIENIIGLDIPPKQNYNDLVYYDNKLKADQRQRLQGLLGDKK